jgi:hypothetical protein
MPDGAGQAVVKDMRDLVLGKCYIVDADIVNAAYEIGTMLAGAEANSDSVARIVVAVGVV